MNVGHVIMRSAAPRLKNILPQEPLPKWNLSDVDHNTIADPRNDVPQPYIRASGSSGIPSGDESGQYVMVESSAPSSGRSTQSAWKFSGYRVKLVRARCTIHLGWA